MIIINYHNILAQPPNPFFAKVRREWHTQAEFEHQVLALRERFEIVSLQEIVAALRSGRKIPNACAITFDDGNLGAYKYGLSILEKYDIPATFFIITQKVENGIQRTWGYFDWLEAALHSTTKQSLNLSEFDLGAFSLRDFDQKTAFYKAFRRRIKVIPAKEKECIDVSIARQLAVDEEKIGEYLDHEAYRMMRWEHISDLLARGGVVGGHTRTHPSLSQIDAAQLQDEICGSYTDLRDKLDLKEIAFAYPFGNLQHVSKAAIETVRQSGYNCAVTMFKGNNKPGVDLFQLRRMDFNRIAKKYGMRR